jgi:hypothetical protein
MAVLCWCSHRSKFNAFIDKWHGGRLRSLWRRGFNYHVLFEDGDSEPSVREDLIRPILSSNKPVFAAASPTTLRPSSTSTSISGPSPRFMRGQRVEAVFSGGKGRHDPVKTLRGRELRLSLFQAKEFIAKASSFVQLQLLLLLLLLLLSTKRNGMFSFSVMMKAMQC